MSNSVPKIVEGQFTVDKGLDDHPVYFLTVNGKKVVVKGEAKGMEVLGRSDDDTALSIKWGSKLMKNVNDQLVNTKIMDGPEITAFLKTARQKFRPLPPLPGGPPAPPPPNRYNNVTDAVAGRYTWVKMPQVSGLSDAEFTKKVGGFAKPVRGKVKEQIVKFADESLWPQLGKVLAVDIFNGNNDRFDTSNGKWMNPGNVMFAEQGTRVIGLDTFDPYSPKSNLVGHGRFDELKTLTEPLKRKRYAEACAKSVGETLAFDAFGPGQQSITVRFPNGDEFSFWQIKRGELDDMYTPFAPALAAGIAKGADQLKTYLQGKVTQYRLRCRAQPPQKPVPQPGQMRMRPRVLRPAPLKPDPLRMNARPINGIPQGILDRMDFLGWLK